MRWGADPSAANDGARKNQMGSPVSHPRKGRVWEGKVAKGGWCGVLGVVVIDERFGVFAVGLGGRGVDVVGVE